MKNPRVFFAYFLCALGFLMSAYWFYPGYMSYDSVVQMLQALHFQFTNTHPPIMAFVWHYLMLLTPRGVSISFVMFLFQLLLLWVALTLWVYLLAKRQLRYLWLIPLVGLFPNIIILNAFIWKDIQMGNSLLLALTLWVLLREGIRTEYLKIIVMILMVLLVFYAFCLRHEAPLLCLPVFYLWAGDLGMRRRFARVLLMLGFFLTFSGGAWLFQATLSTHEDYPAQQVMFYDLASLSIKENHMLIPLDDCSHPSTCFENVRNAYDPSSVLTVLTDFVTGVPNPTWFEQVKRRSPDFRPLQWTYSASNYEQLRAAWLHAIIDHPGLYLQERVRFFVGRLSYTPFFYGIKLNVLSHPGFYDAMPANGIVHLLFSLYALLSFLFIFTFTLWFWLGSNVVLLIFLQTKGDLCSFYAPVKAMLLSGLILCLSHFIVAATDEFRFFYWTMLATLFSFLVLFVTNIVSIIFL